MKLLVLSLVIFLTACTTTPTKRDDLGLLSAGIGVHAGNYYADIPSPPSPPPVTASAPADSIERVEITGGSIGFRPGMLVRDYLRAGTAPNAPQFAYVYFPHRPVDDVEEKQYMAVCKHWRAIIPPRNEAPRKSVKLVSFYWPLRGPAPKETASTNEVCEYLVENYDYGLANEARSSMAFRDYVQLVYVDANTETFIYFNMSRMETSSYKNAFHMWRDKVLTLRGVDEFKLYDINSMFRKLALAYFKIPVHAISASFSN